MGAEGCFRIYRMDSLPRFGLGSCDRYKLPFEYPSFFGQRAMCEAAHVRIGWMGTKISRVPEPGGAHGTEKKFKTS
jgi:hypothetical protein